MNLSAAAEGFSCWIDATTNATVGWRDRWTARHVIKLTEERHGEFILQAPESVRAQKLVVTDGGLEGVFSPELAAILPGSRVELTLRPHQLLFRQIELPARAAEFLDGILRAQIDSLTPWNADDCAYGWSKPVQVMADRIVLNIAAGALQSLRPYARAFSNAGAYSVSMHAMSENSTDQAPIKIWEERTQGRVKLQKIRRLLVFILLSAVITATVAATTSAVVSSRIAAEQEQLAEQIDRARTAAGIRKDREGRSEADTLNRLIQRKQHARPTVMVIDDLSRLLPGHTYLTELRAEGDKLRISGITRDAPSLIGLLEQSGRFTKASFFAPTTRATSSPGERFHIEATIQPTLNVLQ